MPDDSAPATRRGLLAAGLGALAATVVNALGRTPVARAADPNDVVLGSSANSASTTTAINENVSNHSAFWGNATFVGFVGTTPGNAVGVRGDTNSVGADGTRPAAGVWGRAASGNIDSQAVGVLGTTASSDTKSAGVLGLGNGGARGVVGRGTSGSIGVVAQSDGVALLASSSGAVAVEAGGNSAVFPAVRARNTGAGVAVSATQWSGAPGPGNFPPSASTPTGVFGTSEPLNGTGVWGNAKGRGVFGETTVGVGLAGLATTGKALSTDGRIEFKKVSGVATIAAGATEVIIAPTVTVTTETFVLLTPRANLAGRDYWVVMDVPNNRFTIRISSSRSAATKFGWLLVG